MSVKEVDFNPAIICLLQGVCRIARTRYEDMTASHVFTCKEDIVLKKGISCIRNSYEKAFVIQW